MKRRLVIFCTLLLAISVTGCIHTKVAVFPKQQEGILYVSPMSFFEDARGLEPHMGKYWGTAVDIRYKGTKSQITSYYEIWENGKVKETKFELGSPISNKHIGNFSVSVKEEDSDKSPAYKITTVIGDENGYGATGSPLSINIQDNKCVWSLMEPTQTDEALPVTVWALTDGNGKQTGSPKKIDEEAMKAKWALVVKLKLTD